ncbi:MAG: protease, partial [Nitrososphaerales archaeon]
MIVRTTILFTSLTIMLMLFGFLIGLAINVSPIGLMLVGLIFAGVINFASYEFSDRFVLWSTHAKLITEAQSPQLYS